MSNHTNYRVDTPAELALRQALKDAGITPETSAESSTRTDLMFTEPTLFEFPHTGQGDQR